MSHQLVHLNLESDIYLKVKNIADIERRTITATIHVLLEQALMTNSACDVLGINPSDNFVKGLSAVKNELEKSGKYWNTHCLSANDMYSKIEREIPSLILSTKEKSNILKSLGFYQKERVLKIDGKTRRIWVKREMTNAAIRESMKGIDDFLK